MWCVGEEAALEQALHSAGARCRRRDGGPDGMGVECMTGAGRDNEAGLDVEMWCAVQCSTEARGELGRGLWAIDGGGKAQIE